jgi:hypothetical protein
MITAALKSIRKIDRRPLIFCLEFPCLMLLWLEVEGPQVRGRSIGHRRGRKWPTALA